MRKDMPYEMQIDADGEYVKCRMYGDLYLSELYTFASDLVTLLNKHNCFRLFNDMRDTHLRFSTIELYRIPDIIFKAGINQATKAAVVFSKDSDDFHFF